MVTKSRKKDESSEESEDGENVVDFENNEVEETHIVKKKNHKKVRTNERIFRELLTNQIPDVPSQWKLGINDIKRICDYIDTSIFDPEQCCIWTGYITNENNTNKGTYVNFYFKNKKIALHRLLYSNYVAPLDETDYLKFSCSNKGICCNVNHYEKYKYLRSKTSSSRTSVNKKKAVMVMTDADEIVVDFD